MDNSGFIALAVGIVPLVSGILQIRSSHSKKYSPQIREIKEHQLTAVYKPICEGLQNNGLNMPSVEMISTIKEIHEREYLYIDTDIHELEVRIVESFDADNIKMLISEYSIYFSLMRSIYEKLRKELGYSQSKVLNIFRTKPHWLQLLFWVFIVVSLICLLIFIAINVIQGINNRKANSWLYLLSLPIFVSELIVLLFDSNYYDKFRNNKIKAKTRATAKPAIKR